MDTLSRLFRTSVRWNTIGAIGYQCLLFAHQAALYKLMPLATYGTMSIVLSLVYFGAIVVDGGLDATLATFFHRLTTRRDSFKKALVPHWIGIFALATTLSLIFYSYHDRFFQTISLSPCVALSVGLILLAESFRRSLRMTLQLAFKAKIVAIIDSGSMIIYLFLVWGSYACGKQLSLDLLMGTLALMSTISTLMMSFFVVQWQQKLSDTEAPPNTILKNLQGQISLREISQETLLENNLLQNFSDNKISEQKFSQQDISQRQLIYQRVVNGGNALTHQLFSGNILVPLVGMSSGLTNAGFVKLASYLAHGLVTIIRKIVGSSGSALLSALKNAPWHIKRPAFWQLSRTLYITIFFCIISLISMSSHLVAHEVITNQQSSILLLVILLILSEGLCISYETLFIIEEKALCAVALNGVTGIVAGLLILGAPTVPLTTLLTIILGTRLALFGAMALVAVHLWQLYPPLPLVTGKFLPRTVIFGGLATGLAYLCGSPLALLLSR